MSLLPTNLKRVCSPENDRKPTCTSNVTTAPTHTLSGLDYDIDQKNFPSSLRLPDETKSSIKNTLIVADPNYIYYRIYAEDGAIPSKTLFAPGNPFLGRIKAISVPPPHTANALKRSIAKVENIKDRTSTSLFLTPYSQSPMGDPDKIAIFNRTGPGSIGTPQEPLALVAKMSDSDRSALESDGRGGLASAAETDTTLPEIRYLYYLLYADDYEMPSKVVIDPEKPSLGRIQADSVTPPHSPASIKRCISRVERCPALAHADLFLDLSCDTPSKEGYILILPTDGPGLSPNDPMAIVQMPIIQVPVENPSIPDGTYVIKNRAADIYWNTVVNPITKVFFWSTMIKVKNASNCTVTQWDITQDTNGNIYMRSLFAPSSWVGSELTGSTVPVPWRLIPADSKFYYLTMDMNRVSPSPRVPVAQPGENYNTPGLMATLKEGDQWQMWEFIHI